MAVFQHVASSSVQMRLSDSICFFTEESGLSVSVGGEELPSMTPESQIQVSNAIRWHHITYLHVWGLRKSTVMFLTAFSMVLPGSALCPAHV